MPALSRTGGWFWDTEYGRAASLLFQLLEDQATPADIRSMLEEVVREVQSLYFAVLVVSYCHQRSRRLSSRIDAQIDLQVLRGLAAGRLRTYFIEENRDFFAELPESDWVFILSEWGTDWKTHERENRAAVHSYVIRLIDMKPEYLGQLLCSFLQKAPETVFDFKKFAQFFDPTMINERLGHHGVRH